MSVNAAQEESVLISLSTSTPINLSLPERRIVLTESKPKVNIGRSSNRTTLGLIPNIANGWFDSPVMSRHHAEIEADFQRQTLKLRDAGSMHGTYLNKEKVGADESRPLVAGDEVTFGMPVYRNQTIFKPATIAVVMEFRKAARADNSPSRVFTVPDDCSTDENLDENEPLDDDPQKETSSFLGQQENPSEEQRSNPLGIRQMDGSFEVFSDSAPNDLISISSDDDDDVDDVPQDDDEESISLTDDEPMSSAPASPIQSVDLDDTVQMDEDEIRTPASNRVPTDSESEKTDENSPSHRLLSDDEQGVFLYDSDSEEMDEYEDDDPIDEDFYPSTQMDNPSSHLLSVSHLPGFIAPVLPPLSAAFSSQPQILEMPFSYQLPPVVQSAPRQPSPSDAVLPHSLRHHGSEDDGALPVENLGRKWGKTDFFEAREHNKITISHLTEPNPSLGASLMPDAVTKPTNDTDSNDIYVRDVSKDSAERVTFTEMDTGRLEGPKPSQDASREAEPDQNAIRPVETHGQCSTLIQESQSPQGSKPALNPSLLESGKVFLNSPMQEASTMDLTTTTLAEALDWTPGSAYELQQYKQQNRAQKEQGPESSFEIIDNNLNTDGSTEFLQDRRKGGKRKAADISEANEQELAWHENSNQIHTSVPSSPIAQSETDVPLPTPPTTPQERDNTAPRPTKKIKKIAERVGYAALGGATVGAMVFTSLIYTAPSFV